MRRLLGGLTLFALLAASPARATTAAPVPGTPTDAIALLKWCWDNRDVARYHELFTDNFQYHFDAGNPAGMPYQNTPWTRADELISSSNLLLGGGTSRAPASSVTLTFTDGPTLLPGSAVRGYPWHQQLEAQWTLDITCTDGTTIHGEGLSRWFMVRGDSAAIPQELKDRGFTADSSRWYVERWLEQENTAPIVKAPFEANGKIGSPITVQITAEDPDGDPITSLTAESSDVNGTLYPVADNSSGTYIWIPWPGYVGSHQVTFRAANSLRGAAVTIFNVAPATSNLPPVASLVVTSLGGAASLSVNADGSGSYDPDGRIVSYVFDFGDATTPRRQAGPTTSHTYTKGGIWSVTLTVTDDSGLSASISARDTVIVPTVASLVLSPSSGVAPLAVSADASHSTSSGSIVSYRFDFGDGTVVGPQASPTATHTYAIGNWTASVRVADSFGASANASATVTAKDPSAIPPVASLALSPSSGVAPLDVSTDASHSTSSNSIVSYRFDFGDGTVVGPQTGPTATHTYAVGNWTASVRVTDSYGAIASASASVSVTSASDPVSSLPNLVTNPSFEVSTAGWGAFYNSTITPVAGGHDGLYALEMTGSSAIDYGFGVNDHPDWIHPTT
ncbi:MAG: PKD domain-containing protein, partial [Candidatus Eiseniibacteriota bacterium]